MKKSSLVLAIAATGLTTVGNVAAGSLEDRLMAMEKRLQALEKRIETQDKVIEAKNKKIDQLTSQSGTTSGGWFSNVEIGGVVEVEATSVDPDNAGDTSDINVATVELGIAAQVNDWTSAEIVLLYENDGGTALDVDTATISIADPDSIWQFKTGLYALPFGNFTTHVVSDPITLDAAETADTAIEFGIAQNGLSAAAYVFKGDQTAQNNIDNFGLAFGYEMENDNFSFSGGLGWINDLSEANAVIDTPTTNATNKADAWTAFAQFNMGPFTLLGEYVAALDSLNVYSTTDEPSFYNLEAAYRFNAGAIPSVFAIAFQGSDEASNYAGGQDEERFLAALTMEIMEATSLGLEYKNTETYTGVETDTLTGKLSVEF